MSKSSRRKQTESFDNNILMRIESILDVYVCRRFFLKLYDPFLWIGFIFLKVMYHYWAVAYFHCYLNQMPKPLSHSSYY